MKKSILNLKGAQELSKNEQKLVNGGAPTQPNKKDCLKSNLFEDCAGWPQN